METQGTSVQRKGMDLGRGRANTCDTQNKKKAHGIRQKTC